MRALAGAAPHVCGGECRHHRREGGECCGRGVGVGRDSSSRGGERPGYTASSKWVPVSCSGLEMEISVILKAFLSRKSLINTSPAFLTSNYFSLLVSSVTRQCPGRHISINCRVPSAHWSLVFVVSSAFIIYQLISIQWYWIIQSCSQLVPRCLMFLLSNKQTLCSVHCVTCHWCWVAGQR